MRGTGSRPIISPYFIDQVCLSKVHNHSLFLEQFFTVTCSAGSNQTPVNLNSGPCGVIVDYMFEPFFLAFHIHFTHLPPFVQLLLGLQEVSAISPHESFGLGNDNESIGAMKAGNECDSFIAIAKVLALMLVSFGQDVHIDTPGSHQLPELG